MGTPGNGDGEVVERELQHANLHVAGNRDGGAAGGRLAELICGEETNGVGTVRQRMESKVPSVVLFT